MTVIEFYSLEKKKGRFYLTDSFGMKGMIFSKTIDFVSWFVDKYRIGVDVIVFNKYGEAIAW